MIGMSAAMVTSFMLARQAEPGPRDDVALHLGRAGVDGGRARPQILVLPAAAVDGPRIAALDRGVRTLELDRQLLHAEIGLAPEKLQIRALRPGMPRSHELRDLPVG